MAMKGVRIFIALAEEKQGMSVQQAKYGIFPNRQTMIFMQFY